MDYKFKNLPDVIYGYEKIIPRNFGSIQHLAGSKMIDDMDIMMDITAQQKFTECLANIKDVVIALEKIDGMNAGVVKLGNGMLYPTNRKGYDTRTMGRQYKPLEYLGFLWAVWVDKHYELYDSLLEKGERLAFENCMLQHTLLYNFKKIEPVFLLAKYTADGKKMSHKELSNIADNNGIERPPVLNIGAAIPPEILLKQYPNGKVGAVNGMEGIVYNYEINNNHVECAKFVSNQLLTSDNKDVPNKFNRFKYRIFD